MLSVLALGPNAVRAAESSSALRDWVAAQADLQTWSAGFVQTRTLKTLAHPLISTGRVWFSRSDRFRWELGDPPQTIEIREATQMTLVYPRLKRAERYPLGGDATGPWRDALALLEAGFPRGEADLLARFRVLHQRETKDVVEIALQPKSPGARRLMTQVRIGLGKDRFELRATELHFADGSVLRNDFHKAVLNPAIDDAFFTPPLKPDFKIVEPLKK